MMCWFGVICSKTVSGSVRRLDLGWAGGDVNVKTVSALSKPRWKDV